MPPVQPPIPSSMLPHQFNRLLIPLIVAILLVIGMGTFGFWAFASRQDYKNNTDQKIVAAVKVAQQQTATTDAAQYAEAAKQPLKVYHGSEAYGSIVVGYPKTWSAYVAVSSNSSTGTPVDGYFQPDTVPNTQDPASIFALRIQVIQTSYDQVLAQYTPLVKDQKVTISSFSFAKVPGVVGVRVDGQITSTKQGSMVLLPLRDKTLKVWTESSQFSDDFNKNILPNFSFSP